MNAFRHGYEMSEDVVPFNVRRPAAKSDKGKAMPCEPENHFFGSDRDGNNERFSGRCRWLRRESAELLIVNPATQDASQNRRNL